MSSRHDSTASDTGGPAVLVVCDYYPPAIRAGGPARSIFAIASAESSFARLQVLTRDRDLGDERVFAPSDVERVRASLPTVRVHRLPRSGQIWHVARKLRVLAGRSDLLYLNSLVSPIFSILPVVLVRWRLVPRRPVLLAPRGELSPGALAIKATKKRLALPLLRRMLARLDVTWHAASEREAAEIGVFIGKLPQRVVVRANPAPPSATGPAVGPDGNVLTIAFVGRMVPIKNFLLLARAAALVRVPMRVVVLGALEDQDYWRSCLALTDRLDGSVTLDVRGSVDSGEVATVLAGSDVMVLPTRGESFGRAIAESLAVGCPVMIPDTTLWTPLLSEGAGWLIDPDDPAALASALTAYAARSTADRTAVRARVRAAYAAWWQLTQVHAQSLFVEALERPVEVAG